MNKKIKNKFVKVILLIIIMNIVISFSACAEAVTKEEILNKIQLNENKITYYRYVKEELHIMAEVFRHEYINDLISAENISKKWTEIDSKEQELLKENELLRIEYQKKIQIENTSYLGEFISTAYCIENYPHRCNNGNASLTATGDRPIPYQTIAVDPTVIPLGSKLKIQHPNGNVYYVVANDTGGSIKGRKIDMVCSTHTEALHWGRCTVKIWKIEQ